MTVCVGVPLRTLGLPQIATLIFWPEREATVYTKEFLHSDELPYFSAGSNPSSLINLEPPIALAICYELSVAEHANRAAQSGSVAYIASVAKTAEGMVRAQARMAAIAKQYAMPTAMANCLGKQDGVECSGQSAAWDRQGRLIAQLDSEREGLVVLDVATCESTQAYLE
jgi:predicted amidohydrolase